jgi:hypothetical protein
MQAIFSYCFLYLVNFIVKEFHEMACKYKGQLIHISLLLEKKVKKGFKEYSFKILNVLAFKKYIIKEFCFVSFPNS